VSNPKLAKLILVVLLVCLSPFSLGLKASNGVSQSQDTETAISPTDTETLAPPSDTPTDTETLAPPSDTPSDTDTPTPEDSQTPTLDLSETPTSGTQFPSLTPSQTKIPFTSSPTPFVRLRGDFAPNEILVQLKEMDSPSQSLNNCLPGVNLRVRRTINELQTVVVQVPESSLASSIGYLRKCTGVTAAEPNYTIRAVGVIPSDPGWLLQYGLPAIRAPQGWQITTGSSSVIIAVVDTGISLSHPDLSAKIVNGWDFINSDPIADDDNGHGTHVAGIAAAETNNGTGVAGVSWGALLMPVKVLDASGNGTDLDVANGIIWATNHGAQIINLSLGGPNPSSTLKSAVDYAYSHGVTVVAAAGNDGGNILYPAVYSDVIAVGAVDISNNRAVFSNFGPELDVSAPGVSILSTYPGGSYAYLSGTSMAAPFVSGLASILRGIPGNGSPDVIAWEMESTALDLGPGGRDNLYGYGLIQMDKALRLAIPEPKSGSNRPNNPPTIGFFITPTFTPSPTWTFTSTPLLTSTSTETLTAVPTSAVTDTPQGIITQTPEISGQQTQSLLQTFSFQFWILPCSGALLILLGILVALLSRKKRRPEHYRLAIMK
jgi:subtilisin family serine protease